MNHFDSLISFIRLSGNFLEDYTIPCRKEEHKINIQKKAFGFYNHLGPRFMVFLRISVRKNDRLWRERHLNNYYFVTVFREIKIWKVSFLFGSCLSQCETEHVTHVNQFTKHLKTYVHFCFLCVLWTICDFCGQLHVTRQKHIFTISYIMLFSHQKMMEILLNLPHTYSVQWSCKLYKCFDYWVNLAIEYKYKDMCSSNLSFKIAALLTSPHWADTRPSKANKQ